MKDSTLAVRRAVLKHLKAQSVVTALVPAASIHPQTARSGETWPFVRWGSPTGTNLRAACLNGQVVAGTLHAFSKGRWSNKRLLETAEDHAHRIGTALVAALDRVSLPIAGGRAKIQVTSSQTIPDGDEADAYHCRITIQVRCITG